MRALFLLVTVVGLTIFALQNVQPMSLVFLGMRSPALPLSIWILFTIGVGVVTSLLISGLLAFSNYLSQPRGRTDRKNGRNTFTEDDRTPYPVSPLPRKPDIEPDRNSRNTATQPASGYRTEYGTPTGYNAQTVQQDVPPPNSGNAKTYAQAGASIPADDEDDWVSGGSKIDSQGTEEDWGFENESPSSSAVNDVVEANPRDYEAKQEPQSQSWKGSVYSYGYRDPSQSGVGQTESVYDADYRVLVPPEEAAIPETIVKEVAKNNSEDEEDWGLDEGDELEDDRPSGGPINLKK
ncbi:LapA family protein [Tychonema sp. BBK16]|uniref:LapA family protein n=1 Tax=Tychonema sp. BBK16 TaxID=2699888 RepID=UPI001F19865C|nr:LapA family protein [Tychonema sp. BBK16]MCF6372272.1 LapA family protein [Tychonema sp. BBK16]